MQTVGKTPPTSAVVDVELAAAKVEVTPAKAPFRRKLRRAGLFACGACLVAFPFLFELQSTPRNAFAVTSETRDALHYRYLRAA